MIRKAILGDLESIVSIEQTFGAEAFTKSSLRRFLLSNNLILVYINPLTKIQIAYCIVILRSDTFKARLYSMAVLEEARGQGIGRKMLEAVEEHCWNLNRRQITLEVRTDNQIAINLYQKFGFQITKKLRSYYCEYINGYRMEKDVDLFPK